MDLANDTTPEAQAALTEKLRSMTGAQKLLLVVSLSRSVRELALAGIRQRHPEASEQEILVRLAALQHGRDLALAAYPEIPGLDLP